MCLLLYRVMDMERDPTKSSFYLTAQAQRPDSKTATMTLTLQTAHMIMTLEWCSGLVREPHHNTDPLTLRLHGVR